MTTKAKSRSRIVLEKVLYGALNGINGAGGSLGRLKVRNWLQDNIEYTDWEKGSPNNGKHPRWWIYVNWNSVDLIKAGLLEKQNGIWSITQKGVEAIDTLTAEEVFDLARKAYREWKQSSPDDEESSDISKNRKYILFAGLHFISNAPGAQIDAAHLVLKLPSLISDNLVEEFESYDENWANGFGRRQFGKASRAGWLTRRSGTWTLTESGKQAIETFDSPDKLWEAWESHRTSDDYDGKPLPYLGEVNNAGNWPQTLYNSQNLNVAQVISQVDAGTLALPDIQRPFVWKNAKVRDLLDSMYRGFPIGYFLTWRNPVGHMHDEKICMGCAQQNHGVCY